MRDNMHNLKYNKFHLDLGISQRLEIMAGDNKNTTVQGQRIAKTRLETLSVPFQPRWFCDVKRLGYGSWESPVWK